MKRCLICKSTLEHFYEDIMSDLLKFRCPRCGNFSLERFIEVMIDPHSEDDWRWKLSYWIRNHQTEDEELIISVNQFRDLPDTIEFPSLDQQANNLIIYIGSKIKNYSDRIQIISRYLTSIIGAKMPSEVDYIAEHLSEKGLLYFKKRNDAIEDGPMREFGLTFEGWSYYKSISKSETRVNTNSSLPYDVALSFAGEDRKIARQIADGLIENSINVFYDEYEKSTLWGKDLFEFLDDIYRNKAKYCIMLLSKDYAQKAWPKHERKSAQARAFKENKEYILPIKIDNTEIPGILETVGYISLSETTIPEIIELIKRKLKSK